MGVSAYAFAYKETDDKCREMTEYLSTEGGYWLKEDRWHTGAESFTGAGIRIAEKEKNRILADFSGYRSDRLKLEMKYYYLWSMKENWLTVKSLYHNYARAVREIGKYLGELGMESLDGREMLQEPACLEGIERQSYLHLFHTVARFITDFYDDREETEKDVWILARIPGVKQSAADKRLNHRMDFREIPLYYRDMVKQYMARSNIYRGR